MFNDVPSISVPDSNNNYHPFTDVSDTTAAASDVASGKYFYTAAGVKTAGTASGGGASNIVQGTFTTGTRGTVGSVSLNYTGNGYPVAFLIYVEGGAYNDTASGNTTWYNSVNRYDVGWVAMSKSRTTTVPTYTTSGADNYGVFTYIYKNSTTNPTSYTRGMSMTQNVYSSANAGSGSHCVRFKGNGKTLSYYVGNLTSSDIGLAPATKFSYIVVYSS